MFAQVLKDWRPKDATHGEWVAALKAVLKAMQVGLDALRDSCCGAQQNVQ